MAINMEYVLRQKETIREALVTEIKAIDMQLKVFPVVAEMLKSQDGKVYNKRVDEAVLNCLGTREEKESREHPYHGMWVYLNNGFTPGSLQVNIHTGLSRSAYYSEVSPEGKGAMISLAGKATRFNATPLVEAMEERAETMREAKQKYEDELGNLDDMIDLYVKTYNEVLHFEKTVTSTFRQHLNLKCVY